MFTSLLDLFKKPSAKTLAQRELESNQRNLLLEESEASYHAKMAEYYETNIKRLTSYIKEE